jgi:hypothetical protein
MKKEALLQIWVAQLVRVQSGHKKQAKPNET